MKSFKMKKIAIIFAIVILVVAGFSVIFKTSLPKSNSNQLNPEKEITHGHGLSVDVQDPSKLYIATHHGLLVLINEKDLYRVGTSRDDYMGFSAHPTKSKVFFSSGHPESGGNIGFQKSEDGGYTWKKISDGLDGPVDFHAMAMSPLNPDLVYGWYQGTLQRTTDGGKSWMKYSTPVPFVNLAASITDINTIYAASPQGLFLSTVQGEKWQKLFDGFVSTVAINPKKGQNLLSFSEKFGLAKSSNEGKNWEKINADFNGETPLYISYEKQKGETVYLLTEKNSIYKSSNSGDSWNKIR